MSKKKEDKLTLVNFRDLGGLEVANGKKIKHGLIYRTAAFEPETQTDFDYIKNMNLNTVIDLRSPSEIAETPDVLPETVKHIEAVVYNSDNYKHLVPTNKTKYAILFMSKKKVDSLYELMKDVYAYMPYSKDAYSNIFKCMDEHQTFAFHCMAGKDRTGIGALLIELTFGRTYEQCLEQYLYSDVVRKEFNEYMEWKTNLAPARKHIKDFAKYCLYVHKELFDQAYNAIFSKYNTFQDFLKDVYGITPEQIKDWEEFYLE